MPVMDGLTCVKKIRELEALGKIKGHVPVIAVTANARKGMFVFSYLVFSSIPCSAPPILSVFAPNYLRQGIGCFTRGESDFFTQTLTKHLMG